MRKQCEHKITVIDKDGLYFTHKCFTCGEKLGVAYPIHKSFYELTCRYCGKILGNPHGHFVHLTHHKVGYLTTEGKRNKLYIAKEKGLPAPFFHHCKKQASCNSL